MAKGWQEGRQTILVEVRAEDGHPEEDDNQSPGWRQEEPRRIRWREEPGRRQEPVGTQIPAMMAAHGGADGERSHGGGRAADSRGPTDGDRAGGGGGGDGDGDGEPTSQGDAEDPESQGGADDSGDRGEGRDPEGHGGAGATEDQGGARGKEEPDRARGTEG